MEMTIGRNIKRLRTAKSITQEQLSAAMNVTCAAVSKWERGETYPDITLLQPLAYYFGVTLDELMGYDQEKIQTEIDEVIALYRTHWNSDPKKAREIIIQAYHDYPNNDWIMHYYMWNLAGDMADNDPSVLLAYKEEFLAICEKILAGSTEETLRLNAWNMRAKILHAEGRTEEALEIYRTKFTDWFSTCGQKSEQLFAKNSDEYLEHLHKNLYALIDFAGDKLGRSVFFDRSRTMQEKTERALRYGELMLDAYAQTGEVCFALLAKSFLGRMENDLNFRGGGEEAIIAVMEKHLEATQKLGECIRENAPLKHAYMDRRASSVEGDDLLAWTVNSRLHAERGRRAELLKNPAYAEVLQKYS